MDGQVAVVTGANSGIGLETARELSKRGAKVSKPPPSPKPSHFKNFPLYFFIVTKGVMQGKLIAVVYTLRTQWYQFSLGGICKQE